MVFLSDNGIACVLDVLRLVLLVAIMGIASYHDVRSREIPDYVWIIGGGIGAILYIFDWHSVDHYVLFSIGMGFVIAFLIWRLFPMGDADALAIITVSVACPVSFGAVMNPPVVFLGGLFLEHMYAFFYNVRYNLADALGPMGLFGGVENSRLGKAMAFYSVHRKRNHEKFTFCAERVCNGKKHISFKTPPADSDYETRQGVFVSWAMPACPFMLAALMLGILVTAGLSR